MEDISQLAKMEIDVSDSKDDNNGNNVINSIGGKILTMHVMQLMQTHCLEYR